MQIKFDRQEYLVFEEIFEVGQLDDVTKELSEFSDDIEDMAYELAYTRYALAKIEARHNALREAVAWERECCQDIRPLFAWSGLYLRHGEGYVDGVAEDLRSIQDAARAEVDRLIADCKGEG